MYYQDRGCSGGYDDDKRPTSAVLPLPAGVLPSDVIGPGGENVKWLKRQTGVRRINVTRRGGIVIHGEHARVAAARPLLEGQLQALLQGAGEKCCLMAERDNSPLLILQNMPFGLFLYVC